LDTEVHNLSLDNQASGEIHLVDAVQGHGYYNFKFTVHATDQAGNQSDFIFSGDADSFCTASADISN
jgi:hypothetical protein